MKPTLFVIDESPGIRRIFEQSAEKNSYSLLYFTDGPAALEKAKHVKPDIIIADYHLEGLTFTTFCDKLANLDILPQPFLALLVGSSDRYDEAGMVSRGVHAFLQKPIQDDQILDLLDTFQSNRKGHERKIVKKSTRSWPPETQMTDLEDPSAIEEEAEDLCDPDSLQPILPHVDSTEPVQQATDNSAPSQAGEEQALSSSPISQNTAQSPKGSQKAQSERSPAMAPVSDAKGSKESKRPPNNTTKKDQNLAVPPKLQASAPEGSPPEAETKTAELSMSPPPPTPPLGLADPFPKLDRRESAAVTAAAAGAVLNLKLQKSKTERPPMSPSRPPLNALPADSPTEGLPPSLETAMRGFLDQLVQMVGANQGPSASSIQELVNHQVMTQLQPMVEQAVKTYMTVRFSEEELKKSIRPLLEELVTGLVATKLHTIEQTIRESITNQATQQVQDLTKTMVKESMDSVVKKYLPEAMKEQAHSVDSLMKEAAIEIVMPNIQDSVEKVVREVAGERIGQAVETIVPDLAETQIKKELERLTSAS